MRLRYIILCFQIIYFVIPLSAQDAAGSDIVSRTFLSPDGATKVEQCVYDNGLGDVVQETRSFPGSSLPDIVVRHEYDDHRRRTKSWLPVTSSGGSYVSGGSIADLAQSQYFDTAPFSRTEYDGFLPSQPAAQYKAGAQWQSNGKKVSVIYSEFAGAGMFAPEDGYLFITSDSEKYLCTRTLDEDSCWSAEYTDLNGRLMISETSQGKTYYVYNVKGDISYVIPPILSAYLITHYEPRFGNIPDTDGMMQKYAYIYRYDSQRHCVYKKLPGCEPVYYVYDRTGACILSQDGSQRQRGEWAYSIPDKFGRPCVTGVCNNAVSYTAEPLHSKFVYAEYDGGSVRTGGYAVRNFSLISPILYTAAYYDDYRFILLHGLSSSLTASSVSEVNIDTTLGRGMQTGSATAILSGGVVAGYTYSAIYYDPWYNIAQVKSKNHLGGTDVTSTSYSFTGKPLDVRVQSATDGIGTVEVRHAYTYDSADRKDTYTLSATMGGPVKSTTQVYEYDGLGRLSCIYRPFTGAADHNVRYTYDLHGWLTGIATNSFVEELSYADGPGTPCYNGNISSMWWKNKRYAPKRGYKFAYDDTNRLTQASYGEGDALTDIANKFKECMEYDANGNVTRIVRRGKCSQNSFGEMDNLTLAYNGNQLKSVSESAADNNVSGSFEYKRANGSYYMYDSNGSLKADMSRGMAYIAYDSNGNPSRIYFTNGNETRYVYSATGQKLRVVHYTAKPNITRTLGRQPSDLTPEQILYRDSTDYLLGGDLVVKNGKVDKLLFDDGYARSQATSGTFVFFYYNKDHLGNNRELSDAKGAVRHVINYYPSGMPYTGDPAVLSIDFQPYKYNGKEFDKMHGLNTYDYGARQYDPVLARWDRMDPLCEKYYGISPYAYCLNNPVKFIDPDGKVVETVWDLANVVMDVASCAGNVRDGNYFSAAVDAGATLVDAAATLIPCVPGGAGTALKAYRAGKAAHAAETTYKATKNNYRKVLQKATGKTGDGYEAHHTLPQKYRDKFEELGINIDEPGNVVWRETKNHRKNNSKLTKEWEKYMEKNHTKKQILNKRDELEKQYYGNKCDKPSN